MKVRFWGVRGSVPTPGKNTIKYGGNTPCIEVRSDSGDLLIIDAGTGIRELGNYLIANDLPKGSLQLNIFLSHTHWDHIQGIPFFGPAFIPSSVITFRGPVNALGKDLKEVVAGQMLYSYFPINLKELRAEMNFIEIREQTIVLDPFTITTRYLNHPIFCLGYRIECQGKSFVTIYDNEPYRNVFADQKKNGVAIADESMLKEADQAVKEQNQKIVDFAQNADFIVYDAQYTADEYLTKIGWGHSSIDHAVEAGIASNCRKLALFHHDPVRSDKDLDILQVETQNKVKGLGKKMLVFFARERLEVDL